MGLSSQLPCRWKVAVIISGNCSAEQNSGAASAYLCEGRVHLHHVLHDSNTMLGPLSAPVWKLCGEREQQRWQLAVLRATFEDCEADFYLSCFQRSSHKYI